MEMALTGICYHHYREWPNSTPFCKQWLLSAACWNTTGIIASPTLLWLPQQGSPPKPALSLTTTSPMTVSRATLLLIYEPVVQLLHYTVMNHFDLQLFDPQPAHYCWEVLLPSQPAPGTLPPAATRIATMASFVTDHYTSHMIVGRTTLPPNLLVPSQPIAVVAQPCCG